MSGVKQYGFLQLVKKDSPVAQKTLDLHHGDVAKILLAQGVLLGEYRLVESEKDGVAYLGWKADGWPAPAFVRRNG